MSKARVQLNALHRWQSLAASIPSRDPMNLAWVGVYPLDMRDSSNIQFLRNRGQLIPSASDRVYRIRVFEVLKTLSEQDVWIGETELTNRFDGFAYGDEDLAQKLEQLGISMDVLALPYRSDYPI